MQIEVPPPIEPYNWLCLDLETGHGRIEDAERSLRLTWSPDKRWKDETIGKRFREALAKKQEKRSLIDEAPIKVVTLRSETELRCLHWLYQHEPRELNGGLVEGFESLRGMLIALRGLLDTRVDVHTPLVGHNIIAFDLPKLRWAYIAERLRLPASLHEHDQAVYDVMREFCRRYTVDKDIMIALEEVLEQFGLTSHKHLVSGEQIPNLIERGQYDLVIQYALLDVLAESDLFLRMTGGLEDEVPTVDATRDPRTGEVTMAPLTSPQPSPESAIIDF